MMISLTKEEAKWLLAEMQHCANSNSIEKRRGTADRIGKKLFREGVRLE